MKAYETSAMVEPDGDIRVTGTPFSPGTEVEVTIAPKRMPADEFSALWQRLTRTLRNSPGVGSIGDDEIQREVDEFRAGR